MNGTEVIRNNAKKFFFEERRVHYNKLQRNEV